jgi:DNA-directed RNA polymerase subunit B
MILPEVDMPYCGTSGIVPDLIFNPHSMPTRNTPSHLMETLLGKAAACAGVQRYDATAFERTDPIGEAVARLEALGMERHGHEVLYNGLTGQAMACDIFVGVNYYGRLKHMVADKLQFRTADGPINAITHQPTKAIGGGSGGLRIGEMERDAVYSHGMATFLQESFTVRSDAKRGFESRVNVDAGGRLATDSVSSAVLDGGPSQRAHVRLPHAFNLLQQELQAMSIDTRLDVEVVTDAADAAAAVDHHGDEEDYKSSNSEASDAEDEQDAFADEEDEDEDIDDTPDEDPEEENDGGRYEEDG